MNKAELIKKVAAKEEVAQAEVSKIINTLVEVITDELKEGNKITIAGFGTFEAKESAERIGRNPRNPEEEIVIPAKKRATFKASKVLKDKLNDK